MKNKLTKNMTLDTHSAVWWTSIITLLLVLAQQIAHVFGWQITSDQVNQIMGIVNTCLAIASSLGLVYDTSKINKSNIKEAK